MEKPLFSFGVVADIQYADKDIGSYEDRFQRYREAPGKFETAVEEFNQDQDKISFILTLGDIIDGNESIPKTEQDFDVVLKLLDKLRVKPVHHILGNHCLSLPREVMISSLNMPDRYYTQQLSHGWRLIVLDSMDLSVRWPEGTPERIAGEDYLKNHPLSEEEPQMSVWNGGIGSEQKKWLLSTLKSSDRLGEKVFVALHHPLVEGSAPPTHLVWNHAEIRQILVDCPAVVAVFCGHYHVGGYKKVESTHFVTFEAILEAPSDEVAHATVDISSTEIHINGRGTVTSRKLDI